MAVTPRPVGTGAERALDEVFGFYGAVHVGQGLYSSMLNTLGIL